MTEKNPEDTPLPEDVTVETDETVVSFTPEAGNDGVTYDAETIVSESVSQFGPPSSPAETFPEPHFSGTSAEANSPFSTPPYPPAQQPPAGSPTPPNPYGFSGGSDYSHPNPQTQYPSPSAGASYTPPASSPYGNPQGAPYGQPYPTSAYEPVQFQEVPWSQKSKLAAGLFGVFLGTFGVHNFYLGFTGKAIAQLLITILSFGILAWVSTIWGLIEGILVLSSTTGTKWDLDAQGLPMRPIGEQG